MASKLNSEFNYRFQVNGETIWEKIKILKGFVEGRKRAEALEHVHDLKYQSKVEKLKHLQENGPLYEALELEADIAEIDSGRADLEHAYRLNKEELAILDNLLREAYEIAEPSRVEGYSDEDMFEYNAVNEFTTLLAREIQAEIIATGRPSPAKVKNAMSNPVTWNALIEAGLIPKGNKIIGTSEYPLKIKGKTPKQLGSAN